MKACKTQENKIKLPNKQTNKTRTEENKTPPELKRCRFEYKRQNFYYCFLLIIYESKTNREYERVDYEKM